MLFSGEDIYRCLLQDVTLRHETELTRRGFLLGEVHKGLQQFALRLCSQSFLPLIFGKVAVEHQFDS